MDPTSIEFDAIGTHWLIELYEEIDEQRKSSLSDEVLERIEEFDRSYSRFRDDSLVSRMAGSGGAFELPDDAEPLLDLYVEIERLSRGAVTPLIGRTLEEAGYDPQYSLKPGILTAPPRWDEAVDYDFPRITLRKPLLLDLGAAGKGYLVDLVAEILESVGLRRYLINAGGDIYYREAGRSKEIGLEDPAAAETAIGLLSLPSGMSVCGSAGNRRRWDRFTHIINPKTLRSPSEIEATWVVAKTALLADMLATALFFVPYNTLRKQYTFEYALLHRGYSLSHSPDFPAKFFTGEETIK